MYENRNKPKAILYQLLKDENLHQISISQVKNTIAEYKEKKYGNTNISLTQLTNFINANLKVPESMDEAFVVAFERSGDDEEPWFRYFVSTKRLLSMAIDAEIVHADATLKITIQGYPLLACGTSDKGGHFHLFGLMLATNETSEDYEFMFNSIIKGVSVVFNKQIEPKILIAHAAAAIKNGFENAFKTVVVIIMCWFHVVLNFHKRKFDKPENEDTIKDDLRQLHLTYNEELFEIGSQLFLQKWSPTELEFTSNFERYYLRRNRNWYNGATKVKCPKTNNCLERFNGTLKQCQTHYERKTLAVFKTDLMDIVSARSAEYIKNKRFQDEIVIEKKNDGCWLSVFEIKQERICFDCREYVHELLCVCGIK